MPSSKLDKTQGNGESLLSLMAEAMRHKRKPEMYRIVNGEESAEEKVAQLRELCEKARDKLSKRLSTLIQFATDHPEIGYECVYPILKEDLTQTQIEEGLIDLFEERGVPYEHLISSALESD